MTKEDKEQLDYVAKKIAEEAGKKFIIWACAIVIWLIVITLAIVNNG